MRLPRGLSLGLLIAATVLPACGGGETTIDRVLHLDLRRENGLSAASAIRAAHGPEELIAGWEPLGQGLDDPAREAGDWGLVALGEQAYRAWPASFTVPLFAHVKVPAKGRLHSACASLRVEDAEFQIDARVEGGEWIELVRRSTPAARWVELQHDLDEYAGQEIDLRFRVMTPGPYKPSLETPTSLHALWGTPQVRGARPESRRPNVVVITLDTTRGDVLGKGFTPNLDALAERGTLFERAYSTTNSTIPSHASIFTGLPLEEHGAIGNRHEFGSANRTMAERLRAGGYHTAAAVSVSLLRPGFGFGQGFDRFELPHANAFRDGEPAAEVATEWVRDFAADEIPFFLWLHLFDPHTPYGPPPAFAKRFMKEHGLTAPAPRADPPTIPVWDRPPEQLGFLEDTTSLNRVTFEYYLSVAYADSLVGMLLDALEETNALDNTLIAVTADHGESFGEREYWFEHANLYPEVVHVPLILAGPGVEEGARVSDEVSSVDLLPTLLNAAAVPDDALPGIDLLPLTHGASAPDRRVWFQLAGPIGRQAGFRDIDHHFIATLEDGLKWISGAEVNEEGLRVPAYRTEPGGTLHLYEIQTDPNLDLDLTSQQSKQAQSLAEVVREWLDSRRAARVTKRALTESEELQIKGLGYAGYD